MDFVTLKQIMSPYSGRMVKPKITEKDMGDVIHVEAAWFCPSSGMFLQRGLVEIIDKPQPQATPVTEDPKK